MNTKTLTIAAVVIAATASLALAPTLATTAMADPGGVNPGRTDTCVHNGNLNESPGPCENEHSGSTISTCKYHGKPIDCDDIPE
jgi:hypothetical protein